MRIPFDIRIQHDNNLNAPHLLADEDRAKLEAGEMLRVGGDGICEMCGKVWYDHPVVLGALYLNRACDGTLLKL